MAWNELLYRETKRESDYWSSMAFLMIGMGVATAVAASVIWPKGGSRAFHGILAILLAMFFLGLLWALLAALIVAVHLISGGKKDTEEEDLSELKKEYPRGLNRKLRKKKN